jgi:hypothetical protein
LIFIILYINFLFILRFIIIMLDNPILFIPSFLNITIAAKFPL